MGAQVTEMLGWRTTLVCFLNVASPPELDSSLCAQSAPRTLFNAPLGVAYDLYVGEAVRSCL